MNYKPAYNLYWPAEHSQYLTYDSELSEKYFTYDSEWDKKYFSLVTNLIRTSFSKKPTC